MSEFDEATAFEPVSKTRKKKEMNALQDLGAELVKLPESQLEKLSLPDDLRAAVKDFHRLTKHEAVRRQLQFIGRLMRSIDPQPIEAQLDVWRGQSAQATALMHKIERWRDRLIAEEGALTEFIQNVHDVDATRVRQLIRNARKETAENKPPKSSRALFRLIREALEAHSRIET
ncbi:MAG: ribosome biogenesis factor YjgA [Thiobacillaceae bacterium]|jgi:ribosome-associated protein